MVPGHAEAAIGRFLLLVEPAARRQISATFMVDWGELARLFGYPARPSGYAWWNYCRWEQA